MCKCRCQEGRGDTVTVCALQGHKAESRALRTGLLPPRGALGKGGHGPHQGSGSPLTSVRFCSATDPAAPGLCNSSKRIENVNVCLTDMSLKSPQGPLSSSSVGLTAAPVPASVPGATPALGICSHFPPGTESSPRAVSSPLNCLSPLPGRLP